ncbi:MAG: hypothetical protein ACI8Q1_001556 [Parvicella sp.]|jgi:hypothetical protein
MRMPQFSKINKHRRFNYTPMYYDEQKEELQERIEQAKIKYHQTEATDDLVRKERMKSAFKKSADINVSANRNGAVRRTIILLTIVAMLCYYVITHSSEIFALISN